MTDEKLKIIPKCKGGKHSYFSASGRWLPCCSFPDEGKVLENSIFIKDSFLIENSEDLNFHELDVFTLWLDHIENNYDSSLYMCRKRCSSKSHEIEKKEKDMNWVMEPHILIKKQNDLRQFLEENEIEYDFE
jgi:hypothetical protein